MKIKMQETSLDAWDAWQGKPSGELDAMILRELHKAGPDGLMCWEIEEKIERTHQAVSGNLTHLVERGGVVRLDKRGKTPRGRGAYYWVHSAFRPQASVSMAVEEAQHQLRI